MEIRQSAPERHHLSPSILERVAVVRRRINIRRDDGPNGRSLARSAEGVDDRRLSAGDAVARRREPFYRFLYIIGDDRPRRRRRRSAGPIAISPF